MFRILRLLSFLLAGAPMAIQAQPESAAIQAEKAFAKSDCKKALAFYADAIAGARAEADTQEKWARLSLYHRRSGICSYRAGKFEEALGLYREGAQEAEKAGDREMLRENLHGSAVAMNHLGRQVEALEPAQKALSLARECGHPKHLVPELSEVAILYESSGERAKAQRIFEQLLELSQQQHDQQAELNATENLGELYGWLGDPELGIRYFQRSLKLLPPTDARDITRIYNNLGALYRFAGRLNEARTAYETALRNPGGEENWANRNRALFNLARLEVEFGRHQAARERLEETLKELGGRDPELEARVKGLLSSELLVLGERRLAISVANESLNVARRIQSPEAMVEALTAVARASDEIGTAASALEEAASIVEALRAGAPGYPQALEAVMREGQPVYQLMVDRLVSAGHPEEALVWAERAKARVLNDLLRGGQVAEDTAMTPEERDQERQLAAKVNRVAGDPKRAQPAIAELEEFRKRLYGRHPELGLQRADFAPVPPDQWRKLLPTPDAVLLEYFSLEDGTVLFVVRQQGVTAVRIRKTPAVLRTLVRRFREQLAARDVNYAETARELYRDLLLPAALAKNGSWILSPAGPLWELPFQALIDPQGHHVIESHAISFVPSLTSLAAIRDRHAEGRPALAFLGLGNPVTKAAPLPEAESEVRRIAALYPAGGTKVFTGLDARQERLRENAPSADVIHIATHASLNPLNPLYSTLAFSSGPLPATEILRMPLRARVAVLSACESARGRIAEGEQLIGMGWALTGAGASSSVLSQWMVDSAATERLMVAFHENLRRVPPAEALRQAALRIMREGSRNPFYWGAFFVLGDGFGSR